MAAGTITKWRSTGSGSSRQGPGAVVHSGRRLRRAGEADFLSADGRAVGRDGLRAEQRERGDGREGPDAGGGPSVERCWCRIAQFSERDGGGGLCAVGADVGGDGSVV